MSGTLHSALRQSRNASLFTKQTASLEPTAQTSLYKHKLIIYLFKRRMGTNYSLCSSSFETNDHRGIYRKAFKYLSRNHIMRSGESRRKTHQQFISRLERINPDIIVLGEYHSSHKKIALKCKKCNYEWKAAPSKLLSGRGCPNCGGTMKKTNEQFCKELSVLNPRFEVIGEYVNNKTKISVRCKNCGYEWDDNPKLLLKGQSCKKCHK